MKYSRQKGEHFRSPSAIIGSMKLLQNPMYRTWMNMINRCNNTNVTGYRNYGARGIKVCERWTDTTVVAVGFYAGPNGGLLPLRRKQGFLNFVADMGNRPTPRHSVDRIDNGGMYEPSNCRWASRHEQQANTTKNNKTVGVTFDKTRGKWCAWLMIDKKSVLHKRCNSEKEAIKVRREAELFYGL